MDIAPGLPYQLLQLRTVELRIPRTLNNSSKAEFAMFQSTCLDSWPTNNRVWLLCMDRFSCLDMFLLAAEELPREW